LANAKGVLQPEHVSKDQGALRPGLMLSVSGGGLRTMMAGMWFSRALTEAGIQWDSVTHVSGVSGGQTFATQFAFSPWLRWDLTNLSMPIRDVILKWSEAYANAASPKRVNQQRLATKEDLWEDTKSKFEEVVEQVQQGLDQVSCTLLQSVLNDVLLPALGLIGLDIASWIDAQTSILRASVPDADSLTYDGPHAGLPAASIIQAMTLAPDEWLNMTHQVFLSFDQDLEPAIKPAMLPGATQSKGLNLPLWHVARPDTASSGWQHPMATNLKLRLGIDGEEHAFALPPSEQTLVKQVHAASGSCPGFLTSSDELYNLLYALWGKLVDWVGQNAPTLQPFFHAGGEAGTIDKIMACMPLTPNLASPINVDPPPSWAADGAPHYRGIDGAFGDDTSLIAGLATLTQDCTDEQIDCTVPAKVVLINNVDPPMSSLDVNGTDFGGLAQLFSGGSVGASVGLGFPGPFGTTVPSPRIFEEHFEDLTWTTYSTQSLLAMTYESRYSIATLTTIDNPYWGVRGGVKVTVAIFNLGFGPFDAPLMTPASGPIGKQVLMDVAENNFAPIAARQIEGAVPALKQLLGVTAAP